MDLYVKSASLLKKHGLINGAWVSALNNRIYGVKNPSNNKIVWEVPDMGREETQSAIMAAHNGFKSWKKTTAKERSILLRKWYNLIIENIDDLAHICTLESGKSLNESKGELVYGASFIEWFSEEARRIYGDIPQSPSNNKQMLFFKEPIGAVGLITPWNFPHAMIARKCSAALAAGCTCVIKPAEDTPVSALALGSLAQDAGIPDGVINIVTSSRSNAAQIGKTICESPKIEGISFTGSTRVGKILYNQCSSTVKHIDLELGGNAPFIVFDSAKLENAVQSLIVAKFRNSGQTCVSANRLYVQAGIYDRFVEAIQNEVKSKLNVGDGLQAGVNIGPLINLSQLEKAESYVKDAVSKGAEIILGGKRHALGGLFYEPTILTHCNEDMLCFQDEIFAPVISIKKFETEEEVIEHSNQFDVGLASYFFSQDPAQIFRVSKALESGMVGVNEGLISAAEGAFGGVKQSGLGREGSKYGVDMYLNIKYVCIGDIEK